MRVITGAARGARLLTLEGNDVRPTSGRVKEAIFSMIQFELEGRNVLDLFAGSGQLGIEALSRGAARAVFVDQKNESVAIIKQNIQKTHFVEKSMVVLSDSVEYLSHCKSSFDIALIDPPYGKGLVEAVLPLVAPLMSDYGIIVCEAEKSDVMPQKASDFDLESIHGYGKTAVGVYRKNLKEQL